MDLLKRDLLHIITSIKVIYNQTGDSPVRITGFIIWVPGRPEDVDGLGEEVVVHEPSVDREGSHQHYDVATAKEDMPNLK